MTLARFSTPRLQVLHSCKLLFTWYLLQKDYTEGLCHASRSEVMDGHLNWVSYPQTDSEMCLNSIWAYSISSLSGQQYALQSAEFGGYETSGNTNTPMSSSCHTTVSHHCVSLTLWLSYTFEERHLLRQRPRVVTPNGWAAAGSIRCSEGNFPGQPRWLHLGSMMTRVPSMSEMHWEGRVGRVFCNRKTSLWHR